MSKVGNISFHGELFQGNVISPAIKKAAHDTRLFATLLVRSRTPVKTGKLYTSWRFKEEGNGIRFTNDAPYAAYVEFGTRKMAARGMLTRSLPEIQDHFHRSLARELGKNLATKIVAPPVTAPSYSNNFNSGGGFPVTVSDKKLPSVVDRFRQGLK